MDIPPGSPRTGWRVVKRTLLLASKFTEMAPSRAARLECDPLPHELRRSRVRASSRRAALYFRTIAASTKRLGLPFYFASSIKLARIWYERRRHSYWRCAGLCVHRRRCSRLDSRRKPSLHAKTARE